MAGNWNSGRRPAPHAVHVLRGTVRADHAGRDEKRRGTPGRPAIPAPIEADALARAHWDRLAATLEASGVLTTAHGDGLALLALLRADYDRVRVRLLARPDDRLLHKEARDTANLCTRLLGEFGLTPSSEGRIHAADPVSPAAKRAAKYITPRAG